MSEKAEEIIVGNRPERPTRERVDGKRSVDLTRHSYEAVAAAYDEAVAAEDLYEATVHDIYARYFEQRAAEHPSMWPNYLRGAILDLYMVYAAQNQEPVNWNGYNAEKYPISQWRKAAASHRSEVRKMAKAAKAVDSEALKAA